MMFEGEVQDVCTCSNTCEQVHVIDAVSPIACNGAVRAWGDWAGVGSEGKV